MANTFNPKSNTWIIDSTGVVTSAPTYVKQIRAAVPAANLPAEVVLKNNEASAKIVWETVMTTEPITGDLIEQWWMDGFQVTTLGTNVRLYVDLG